jgi:hypothetical protein
MWWIWLLKRKIMEGSLLEKILGMKTLGSNWDDDWYTVKVASDPNAPPIMLEDILKSNVSYNISYWAAENQNCPPKIKIKWMKENGLIVKEDPKKHIIEYEKIKEDDFQDLKDLL